MDAKDITLIPRLFTKPPWSQLYNKEYGKVSFVVIYA